MSVLGHSKSDITLFSRPYVPLNGRPELPNGRVYRKASILRVWIMLSFLLLV
jgi:hypothetical protein